MTVFYVWLAAYFAGLICGVAQYCKPGRHRARRLSTLELATQSGSWLAALIPVPVLDVAPVCPPMYPPIGDRYEHKSGAGRVRGSVPTVAEVEDEWLVAVS